MAGKKRETLDLSGKSVIVIKKNILTIFNWDFVCSVCLSFSLGKGLKSLSHYTSGQQRRDLRSVLKLVLDNNHLLSLEGLQPFEKLVEVY